MVLLDCTLTSVCIQSKLICYSGEVASTRVLQRPYATWLLGTSAFGAEYHFVTDLCGPQTWYAAVHLTSTRRDFVRGSILLQIFANPLLALERHSTLQFGSSLEGADDEATL